MSLISRLRSGKDKALFSSNVGFAMYSTGFAPLDYINAFHVDYVDEHGELKTETTAGLMGGRFVTIVGFSGTGKSTLADQIAWNIIQPFIDKGAFMMHVDVEQTVIPQRLYDIFGIKPGDYRVDNIVINKEATYIDDVLKIIDDICKEKEAHPEEMYDADGKWFGKKSIKLHVPTVIIIDSLPSFVSSDSNTASIDGQMTTNREVAMVAQFYTKVLPKIAKYNIMVIATNHIRPKIIVDVYNQPPPQLMLLKPSETLPRGQAPIYYATSIFRLNVTGKGAMYKEEEYGFNGFKTIAQATKTKTSFIGGNCSLVFTEATGYDPVYSLLEFAYDREIVDGRNPNLYIKGYPDAKFSKKTFGEKYRTNPVFRDTINKALLPELESMMLSTDERNARIDGINSNKFMSVDEHGNLVADGLVETSDGLEIHIDKQKQTSKE